MDGDIVVSPMVVPDTDLDKQERNYSEESFCSESSNCDVQSKCKSAATLLQKRRKLHAVGNPYRSSASNFGGRCIIVNTPQKQSMSSISQKILSAKMLRLKQLQNELSDAHYQINELVNENRLLRTLQKRQDLALSRFEGKQAELPELINAHSEEVRVLRTNVKQLKTQVRELEVKLKDKDTELSALRDSYADLMKLCKERRLGERDALQKRVEFLQNTNKEQEERIQVLKRKLMLESKNYRHQLNVETSHHRNTQRELAQAVEKEAKLQALLESKEKFISTNMYMSNRLPSSGPSHLRLPDVSNYTKSDLDSKPNLYIEGESIQQNASDRNLKELKGSASFERIKSRTPENVSFSYHTKSRLDDSRVKSLPLYDTDSDMQQTTSSSRGDEDDSVASISVHHNPNLSFDKKMSHIRPSFKSELRNSSEDLSDETSMSSHVKSKKTLNVYSSKTSLAEANEMSLGTLQEITENSCRTNNIEENNSVQSTRSSKSRRGSGSSDGRHSTRPHSSESGAERKLNRFDIADNQKTFPKSLESGRQDSKSNPHEKDENFTFRKDELLAALQAIDKGDDVNSGTNTRSRSQEKHKNKTDLMRELFGAPLTDDKILH